jgi:LmbE family N-acetylglucosaminyl deacetylase
LLCVFAHPDDEVFCAGSLLARWVDAGGEAMVVSATRGEAGQIRDASAATRATLGAVRERELRDACAALGVERVRCLDYHDGTLHTVSLEALAAEVATLMHDFRADVVVTFGPDGGYGHPDHMAISDATTLACRMLGEAGERAPQLYYSAFPGQHQMLSYALADWLEEQEGSFRGAADFVQALALLADEATLLRYADDAVQTQWFPDGFAVVEQGEPASSLYLIVSGSAREVVEDARGSRSVRRTLGPGQFFGAAALAGRTPQGASVVAADTLTCLVMAPQAASTYAGRGAQAEHADGATSAAYGSVPDGAGYLMVEAPACFDRKIAALAAHRTQFAFDPAPFAPAVLRALLGAEHFEQVHMPAIASSSAGANDLARAVRTLVSAAA